MINSINQVMKRISQIQKQINGIFNPNQNNNNQNRTNQNSSNNFSNMVINENAQNTTTTQNTSNANISNRVEIPVTNNAIGSYPFKNIINEAAQKYNLSPALIRAIIKVESNNNPNAISRAGARGLMQLMPQTSKMLGVNNVYNPRQNIMAGSKFFKELFVRFNKDIKKALAAYNAGPTRVSREGIPQDRGVQNYISRVLEYFQRYGG